MDRELDPSLIRFRPLREADITLLYHWLHMPHVQTWWETPASLQDAKEKYLPRIQGQDHVPFVILYDNVPIGYIQSYPVRAGEWGGLASADAAGLDLFIGDPAYVHRGLGARILTRFLKDIVFSPGAATRCFADPAAHNQAAIRTFEKAGFCYVRTVQGAGSPAPLYLMCIDKRNEGETDPV